MLHVFFGSVGFFSRQREQGRSAKRFGTAIGVACIAVAAGSAAIADDVKVQPAAGSGFVVTDQAGTTERLRVNEAGGVEVQPAAGNGFVVTDQVGTTERLRVNEAGGVKVQPAAGSGFVVTDQAGTTERLRVNEAGGVSVPGLAAHSYGSGPGVACQGTDPGVWCGGATPSSSSNLVCRDPATGNLAACKASDVVWSMVTRVVATNAHTCNSGSPCPVTDLVITNCPTGSVPLYTACQKPMSANLYPRLNTSSKDMPTGKTYPNKPYLPTAVTGIMTSNGGYPAGCVFEGSVDPFVTDYLTTITYCLDVGAY